MIGYCLGSSGEAIFILFLFFASIKMDFYIVWKEDGREYRKMAIGYRIKRIRISIFTRQLAPPLHHSGVHRTVGEYSMTPSNNSYRYLLSDTIKPQEQRPTQAQTETRTTRNTKLAAPPSPDCHEKQLDGKPVVCLPVSAYASVPWAPSDTNGHRVNHL